MNVYELPAALSQGITVPVQSDKAHGDVKDQWIKHLP